MRLGDGKGTGGLKYQSYIQGVNVCLLTHILLEARQRL